MPGFSTTVANEILNYVLRGQAMTTLSAAGTPANLYWALFDGDPTGAGVELDYEDYARVAVPRATGSWDDPSGGATQNAILTAFGDPTAGGPQDATHWALMSASSGGTVVLSGELNDPQTITDGGEPPTAAIGDIDINITGS